MRTGDSRSQRGREFPPLADRVFRLVTAGHTAVYWATGGKLGGKLLGSPVLLLETTGRKSGKKRTTPLLYLPDGRNMVIVASKGGAAKHPSWWLNLRANPETTVQAGSRTDAYPPTRRPKNPASKRAASPVDGRAKRAPKRLC